MRIANVAPLLLMLASSSYVLATAVGQKTLGEYTTRLFQGQSGLPEGVVQSMAQTGDGYIWFGTEEGLARFDGVKFTTFDSGNTPAIRENTFAALATSSLNTLWIGTRGGGLVRYRDGTFRSYASEIGPAGDTITALYADREDAVWIGTENRGLIRLSGEHTTYFGPAQGFTAESINKITADSSGTVWIAADRGLFRYSSGSFVSVTPDPSLRGVEAHSLSVGSNGSLWVHFARRGIFHWDGKNWNTIDHPGLREDTVATLLEDRDGALWLGTYNSGLMRYEAGQFSTFGSGEGPRDTIFSLMQDRDGGVWAGGHDVRHLYKGAVTVIGKNEGLASDLALAVYPDPQGTMWVGTDHGLTAWVGGVLHDWVPPDKLAGGQVFSLTKDRGGDLWIGTRHGLFRLHGKLLRHYGITDGLPAEAIFSLFTDRAGHVWVGSRGGLSWFDGTKFHSYSVSDGLPSALVSALYEDREGSLWIGTDGSGLVRLKEGKFFALPAFEAAGANSILSIAGDSDGSLWFGTRASGLLYHRAGKFSLVGRDHGLTFDSIVSIQDDVAGNLWLSSNKGLFRVKKQELREVAAGSRMIAHFRHFDTADGMRTQECNGGFQPAGGRAPDGTLWFPTMRGVAVVDPARANLLRKLHPPIIERILSADRSSDLAKTIKVLPGKRSVAVEFTYPEYQNPDLVTFRYLLEGFDHDWVQAEHRRAAYYTNLPPGEYYFKVSACEGPVCGPPVQTSMIYVQPSFFERKAFWAIAGGLLVGFAILLYRLRIRRLQTKERQLVKLVEARTRELRESRDQLEVRVQERTDELQRTNRMLSEEIEVRRDAEVRAESANRVKTDFLNNMSHELRTPINGIMGMADLTLMTRLDEEQSEYLGIIRRSADDLLGIVVNILDFSSAYSDEVSLEEAPFLLPDELQHVCSICKPKALEKGLAFSLDVDERIPQHLIGDAPKLRRVLRALLENAVKFTASGSVELRLELEKREEAIVAICFSVRDTGIGVPPEKQSAIFEAFSQADTSSTRRYGGTGLGLTICNQLVRLLHGRLWMRSEVGKGSVFCFSVPFAIQPPTYNATLGSDARPSVSGLL